MQKRCQSMTAIDAMREPPALPVQGQNPIQPLVRLDYHIELTQPLVLPFSGTALRGAFGHALRALTEYLQRPDLYGAIFEPAGRGAAPAQANASICPPYVISPSAHVEQARSALSFSMTLWGEAARHQDLVKQAWQMAAMRGLGTQLIPGRILSCTTSQAPFLLESLDSLPSSTAWRLCLTSPVFIKNQRMQERAQPLNANQMDWTQWLHSLHRRLRHLHQWYGAPFEQPGRFEEWLEMQANLDVQAHWVDAGYVRRSQRQQRQIPLQGVQGQALIRGSMHPALLKALLLGQWLHAGSKTALGMGGYVFQPAMPLDADHLHESNRLVH